MHQPSTPTPDYGAPALAILPARGRCAKCTMPIREGQRARHVRVTVDFSGPIPYEHVECPQ